MLDADFFRRWMTTTAAAVDREAAHLTELDSAIGDADHGSNLQRGFTAVVAALEKEPPQTPGAVLMLAGRQLISTVGGASGPLYGTLLRRTGKALGDAPTVTVGDLAQALGTGVTAVAQLGGAQAGDKTMLDALLRRPRRWGRRSRRRGTRRRRARWRPCPCRRARDGPAIWVNGASGIWIRGPRPQPC